MEQIAPPLTAEAVADKMAILELISNWVQWRDRCAWEPLRTIWHSDGKMMASWREGTADEFIEASKKGYAAGDRILHTLAGSSIQLSGHRAVSTTKMTIHQRGPIDGVLCDVTCLSRHYDLWEKRAGRWGLILRETIYERSRLDPVTLGATVTLDPKLLAEFPEEYQHLGYLQAKAGHPVNRHKPVISGGPEVEALYKKGKEWLQGAS